MMFMCGVDTSGMAEQIRSDSVSVLCALRVYKKAQITTWGPTARDCGDKDVGVMEWFEGRDTELSISYNNR